MQFSLNAACQSVTDAPLRIRSLQILKLADNQPVAEIGLAFRYNETAQRFDIYSHTLRLGGKSYSHTRITSCDLGEMVSFSFSSDKGIKKIACKLTQADGTVRTFNTAYSLPVNQVKLNVLGAAKHSTGAGATVVKEKVVIPQRPPLQQATPTQKPPTSTAKK